VFIAIGTAANLRPASDEKAQPLKTPWWGLGWNRISTGQGDSQWLIPKSAVAIVIPDMKKRDSLFQANTGVDLPLAADHRSRLPPMTPHAGVGCFLSQKRYRVSYFQAADQTIVRPARFTSRRIAL